MINVLYLILLPGVVTKLHLSRRGTRACAILNTSMILVNLIYMSVHVARKGQCNNNSVMY